MSNEDIDREVYCRRCGRLLRGVRSKELGFGPNCYRAWKNERNQRGFFDREDENVDVRESKSK